MARTNKTRTIPDIHRYILRTGIVEKDDSAFIADNIIISMGQHGAMHTSPANDLPEKSGISIPEDRMSGVAEHNVAEIQRAMEEGMKWEMKLKEYPLATPLQDFVAYYNDVITLFTQWCTAHGIPPPQVKKTSPVK